MISFPAFIEVGLARPLVIGEGALAAAKAHTLLLKAPRLTLAAIRPPHALASLIEDGTVEVLPRSVDENDIRGRPLVVAASSDNAENERVSRLAQALGVPVNVPDRPELCTFAFGAIVERGDVTVAISTEGAAPALATHLRAQLEQDLHPRLGRVAEMAREYRPQVKERVAAGADRREFWNEVVTGRPAEAILAGDESEARRMIDAMLTGVKTAPAAGRVLLVGAGPGNPELLTLKAVRAIKLADVILHDDLVGPGVLDYARREAEIISVGKRGGAPSTPQAVISGMLVEHARRGKVVARLKGGDPFVFARAAEELQALEAHGIAVEVIPGISAAQACAAEVRLPLTNRGRVRQLSFVTGAVSDCEADLDLEAIARPEQALAVYMGVGTAAFLTERLIAAGRPSTTRAVIVENATRPNQRAIATTLAELPAAIEAKGVRGPAILFVGLDWADAGLAMPSHVETFFAATPAAPALVAGAKSRAHALS
jgi:uroporphyrin-III C-methyltransferase/precorrin-2 dehydrogenase/sirohydrochlorin ferrochelatase